jgi:hypothetical protein
MIRVEAIMNKFVVVVSRQALIEVNVFRMGKSWARCAFGEEVS